MVDTPDQIFHYFIASKSVSGLHKIRRSMDFEDLKLRIVGHAVRSQIPANLTSITSRKTLQT